MPDARSNLDLSLPARVAAEDDTYVAITIRVEKAWLTERLPFLRALVDLASFGYDPNTPALVAARRTRPQAKMRQAKAARTAKQRGS